MKPKAASAPSRASPGETLLNISASSSRWTARSRKNSKAIVTTTGTATRTQRLDLTIPETRTQSLDLTVPSPSGDGMANRLGTVALRKASADAGCRRFVFASSGGAIYGRAANLPTPERTVPKPLSPYGAAKLAAEGYLGMFARTFGLRALALRYSNVYGPFQDG